MKGEQKMICKWNMVSPNSQNKYSPFCSMANVGEILNF